VVAFKSWRAAVRAGAAADRAAKATEDAASAGKEGYGLSPIRSSSDWRVMPWCARCCRTFERGAGKAKSRSASLLVSASTPAWRRVSTATSWLISGFRSSELEAVPGDLRLCQPPPV